MEADAPPRAPWMELRVLRLKDGHTQRSLAVAAGYSKNFISLLERGERRPSVKCVARLAAVLNVPKSVLEPRLAAVTDKEPAA